MSCPQCGENKDIQKDGTAPRKKEKGMKSVSVQIFRCKNCAFKGRGRRFGLDEEVNKKNVQEKTSNVETGSKEC